MSIDEIIRNAIRNPTPDNANQVFTNVIIPDERLEPLATSISQNVYDGADTSVLADQALNGIFDLTETIVLGDGVDHIFDNFGQRIIDLITNGMTSIMERTFAMITSG